MFDLKSKLLEKGFVTKEQVEKITEQKKIKTNKKMSSHEDFIETSRIKALEKLKSESKAEQYRIIRKWIDLNRLDKKSHLSVDCEKFFLTSKDKQITWLTLTKELIEEIKTGNAGVVSYMSNHGLSHAVVPKDIALDISTVFPDWLKVLNAKG